MKNEEKVLSREQMNHLQELGVDTSDASMYWVRAKRITGKRKDDCIDNDMGKWRLSLSKSILLPAAWTRESVPTYTISDLIEKLPKHYYAKEDPIEMCAINGRGAFVVYYYTIANTYMMKGDTIKDALYKSLCWVAEKHKELLEAKK